MATKFVTITGIMTYDDAPVTPPGGGPPVINPGPHPSHPIMLPGMPGWGLVPIAPGGPVDPGYSPPWAQVPGQPPVINPGPHPSHPIMLPGMPGWGSWPSPPTGGGPRPTHPIALPGDPWWGGGGPVDPGYSPPWARPNPPVDPGFSPPWAQVPPGTVPPGGGGGWPGGGTPPEKPGFVPIAGGQPGPFLGATWFYSPVYGWVLGVLPPGTVPPTVPTEPPVEGTEPPPTEPPA